jgi:hypothetical protein
VTDKDLKGPPAVKSFLSSKPKFKRIPGKPSDFTTMPAICVCGKNLSLKLQAPSPLHISWRCYCKDCGWHVSVVLNK